MASAPSFCT